MLELELPQSVSSIIREKCDANIMKLRSWFMLIDVLVLDKFFLSGYPQS